MTIKMIAKKTNIDSIFQDLERIEKLVNTEETCSIEEARNIFSSLSNFINDTDGSYKKFKGSDKEEYGTNIYDWSERQSSVFLSIINDGFEKVICSDEETEIDWVIYEAWILGYLIKKYSK